MKNPFARMILITAFGIAGCSGAAGSNVKQGTNQAQDNASTIIIYGINPAYKTQAFKGSPSDKGWTPYAFPGLQPANVIRTAPKDGYIVATVPSLEASQKYAIARVTIGLSIFQLCSEKTVYTFSAPAGKVIYVGDVNYELTKITGPSSSSTMVQFNDDEKYKAERPVITPTYSDDFAKAKNFIASKYPALLNRLEHAPWTQTTWAKTEVDPSNGGFKCPETE